MATRRRDGQPLWIDDQRAEAHPLQRMDLSGGDGPGYDEAWLQSLLHRHPEVIPIEQIEPGFGRLVPLCRELPLSFGAGRAGALDNLFATADGGLILVEAKLWRNPEARRKVVAQAMEYAAALFRMSYEELESQVLRARRATGESELPIFEIVSRAAGGGDEAEFIDAVSRNLKRGRAIIAVVGDGIREDIAPLAKLLQSHAGHRFTFALVELGIHAAPRDGVRIVVPSVLAQTTLIERGVVRVEADGASINIGISPADQSSLSAPRSVLRPMSISEDEFFEGLRQRDETWPQIVKDFLAEADDFGAYVDMKKTMNLKTESLEGQPLNFGYISKDGYIETGPASWWGRDDLGRMYNEALASAMGGIVRQNRKGEWSLRTKDGKTPKIPDLLPEHSDAWIDAMRGYFSDYMLEHQ